MGPAGGDEALSCNLCGHTKYAGWWEWEGSRLVKCKGCGLVYLHPQPDDKTLQRMYTQDYERAYGKGVAGGREQIEAQMHVYEHLVGLLTHVCRQPGRLLEVGPGYGYFLGCAKRHGWQVTGLELSQAAAEYARTSLGLDVHVGRIEEFEAPGRYDAVAVLHTLEHVTDPTSVLLKLREFLAPKGVLVIVGPNAGSFDRWWHGRHWRGWQIPYHLYHFTVRSYRRFLDKTGFSVVHVECPFWNPLAHVKEAALGDGWRADHPPTVVDRIYGASSWSKVSDCHRLKQSLKAVLGKVLTDRDVTVLAQRLE